MLSEKGTLQNYFYKQHDLYSWTNITNIAERNSDALLQQKAGLQLFSISTMTLWHLSVEKHNSVSLQAFWAKPIESMGYFAYIGFFTIDINQPFMYLEP